ncbi:MAG: hypothetical protein DCC75_04910, partial [Proteobacteria bacterium]
MLVGLTSTRATSRSLMRLNDVRVLQIGDLPLDSQGFSELVLHMPQVKDGLNYVPCAETLKLTFDPAAYVAAELTPNGCVRISVDGLLQAYPVNIGADPATYWVAIDGDGWAPCAELPIIFEAQPKGSTIVNLCVSYGTHPSQDGLRADCSIALTWSCDETSDCRLQYFVSE